MLPGEQMPPVFFIFWSIPSPYAITIPERTKPTLVLEGRDDVAILRAILPPRIVEACKLRPTQGRPHLAEAARTHLCQHRAPVAVLLDTDTLDKAIIREMVRNVEEDLARAAGEVPYGVFSCVPHIEVIFFKAGIDYKRIFPAFRTFFDRETARTDPKRQLELLLEKGGGPKRLSGFLDALTSDEVDEVRYNAPLPQVVAFITNNLDLTNGG
jgi:hypothetical protein